MSGRTAAAMTLVLAAAAVTGCERNPLFLRLASDYYPVTTIGSQWEYELEGGGNLIVTVIDQTVVGERTCYRVLSGADYSYWIGDDGGIERYEDHRVTFNGYEVPLYQAWVRWLEWPLAVGASRTDSASTFAVSQGVTISHDWSRTTTVAELGDSPDGRPDCYRIREVEETVNWIRASGFAPETTTVVRDIWLAPDIGMVHKSTGDSTLVLTGFTAGE